MNNKLKLTIALSLLGLGQTVSADDNLNEEHIKVGFGYTANLREKEEEYVESQGYELSLGYLMKDNWLIETGFAKNGTSSNAYPDNMFLRVKDIWSVSDYAALYIGGGLNYHGSEFYPGANIGVHYELDESLYVDAGYQALFSEDKDNVYSLLLSLNYSLPTAQHSAQTVYTSRPTVKSLAPKPVLVNTEEPCVSKTAHTYEDYIVVRGDNLTFISRRLEKTLDEMVKANPQLTENNRTIDLIYPNEVLHYPVVKDLCIEEREKFYKEYIVVKGDNLTYIARKLDRKLEEIILANPQLALKRNSINLIYPQEVIYYPAKSY